MTIPAMKAIENDPNASLRALQYVADELERQVRERDADRARAFEECLLRDRIRQLRRELEPRLFEQRRGV